MISMLLAGAAFAAGNSETDFLRQNDIAMDRMMKGMAARPSGDVDNDFVNMMEPHHRGAIDMAVLELRYGKNERLRRIAQEIIVDQQQEIAAMHLALGRKLPPSSPAPTGSNNNIPPHGAMSGMSMSH
jgi:uncharacterized protein (DUF305 family)